MDTDNSRLVLPAIIVSAILFIGIFLAYSGAKNRPGKIVLPGGITYLGPTPTQPVTDNRQPIAEGKIPIPADTTWAERRGATLPYALQIPESLSLGVFPDDPYDSLTVFYPGTDAGSNIFFRVDDLTLLKRTEYTGKTREYANNWWKSYTWKGVKSLTEFTNSNGLTGYRALYLDDTDASPYEHIFFEVPGRPGLVIWMSGKLFSREVFDRMTDSVMWRQTGQ